jgi:hypothetical protein
MPEHSMRLNKIVDGMDSALQSLQHSIVDAFQKKQNIESNDLRNISRESEALIVVLSQLDRQVIRMEGVLAEMDVALHGAIQKGFRSSNKDDSGGPRADVL